MKNSGGKLVRTLVTIQSRAASKRLPRKYQELVYKNTSLLELCYARCEQASYPTYILAGDLEVYQWALDRGMRVHHTIPGPLILELETIAKTMQAESIVQVTGDCALPDPARIRQVVHMLEKKEHDFVAYLTPKGMEVRGFTVAALERAIALLEDYSTNGSTIFYRIPQWFIHLLEAEQSPLNYSIDTPEDLAFIRSLCSTLKNPFTATIQEILTCATPL